MIVMNYIRLAKFEDKEEILNLYHSLIGTIGCTWSMDYPTISEIEYDVEKGFLYCMCDEKDAIIAVATAGIDDETEWLMQASNMNKPCILSRVGVKLSMHNHGLGQILVKYVIEDVEKQGYEGIIMLVSKTNPSAIAMYEKLNFTYCGESMMYDIDWFIYKMIFKDS